MFINLNVYSYYCEMHVLFVLYLGDHNQQYGNLQVNTLSFLVVSLVVGSYQTKIVTFIWIFQYKFNVPLSLHNRIQGRG